MITCRRFLARAAVASTLLAVTAVSLACNMRGKADDSTPASTPTARPATAIVPPTATRTAIVIAVPTIAPRPTRSQSGGLVKADAALIITDGKFTLDKSRVTASEIYFSANNDGTQPHSVAIVKWDGDPGALPVSATTGRVTGVQKLVEIDPLDARGFKLFEIEYIVGQYVLFCDLPGHYSRGEYAAITALAP